MIGLILSFSASNNFGGYDISATSFFSDLSDCLNTKFSPPSRSSICEARQKLSWEIFPYLLNVFNEKIATDLNKLKWKNHHVYAVDGSTFTLPYSKEIKSSFPDIGSKATKTHYPKARVVLATHMLSGIPKTLRVDSQFVGERELLQSMLCEIEDDSVLLLDRGFDGIASLQKIIENKKIFLCRLRSDLWSSTEVYHFAKSKQKEKIVTLKNKHKEEIVVRLLKYKKDRNGNAIILATNLFNQKTYTKNELWDLYARRWDIETTYYRIKKLFKIEKFHSKKLNGVFQEIGANLLVLGMISYLIMKSWKQKIKKIIKSKNFPNFKNASLVFKKYFVKLFFSHLLITPMNFLKKIYIEIISVIVSRQPGRKNPRISKQSLSTWVGGRKNKSIKKNGKNPIRKGIYA